VGRAELESRAVNENPCDSAGDKLKETLIGRKFDALCKLTGSVEVRMNRLRMRESHFVRYIALILGYDIFAHMNEFKAIYCFYKILCGHVTQCFASFRMPNCS
jgi:hypothetical protein